MMLSDFEKALGIILGLLLFDTLTNIFGIVIDLDIYHWVVLFSCLFYLLWIFYPFDSKRGT
jgi:hypothetical protein